MGIHFDTMDAAVAHLFAQGWFRFNGSNRRWFKSGRDENGAFDLRARILTTGTEVVLVQVWEE